MRLVLLHKQVVMIANQVAANSLWKAGRPYLCIPMQKNGMVYHIIPFRTAKRKPYMSLTDTVIFPLKRRLGTNADGEYPFLDLSKSFLVRENHFYDLPEDFYVEGYMRVDECIGKIISMSRKYITKMNAGKLEGVKQRFCVDYVAILRELDRLLPNPKAKPKAKRLSKTQLARHSEIQDTYRDVVVHHADAEPLAEHIGTANDTVAPQQMENFASAKAITSTERDQTYAEIDNEINNANAEQGSGAPFVDSVLTGPVAPVRAKTAKGILRDQRNAQIYNTTTADIRAAENEIAYWDKWLEGTDWSLDIKRKEKMDVYNDVDLSEYMPESKPKDLNKAMRDEVYAEIDHEEKTTESDEVDNPLKKRK